MSEHQHTETGRSDLQRAGDWLNGDIRVSRKVLVAGGVLLLVLLGVALD
ncbi:hypothetical protein [Stappia sp.]